MDARLKIASVGILFVLTSGCVGGSLSTREKGAGIGALGGAAAGGAIGAAVGRPGVGGSRRRRVGVGRRCTDR